MCGFVREPGPHEPTAYLTVITARSAIHVFAPHGGARTIATVDTSVAWGDDIIATFGQ